MLPGMLLHMIETAGPVDASRDSLIGFKRPVADMINHAVPIFLYVRDGGYI